jgi:hypothetical protein
MLPEVREAVQVKVVSGTEEISPMLMGTPEQVTSAVGLFRRAGIGLTFTV